MAADDQFIRGAGMLAVLKVLEEGELYGYAIVEALGRTKGEALHLGQSTVYPMLYNLEAKGLVKSRWDDSGARPRKYYSLTKAGKTRLAEDTDQWREITKAMASLGLAKLGLAKLGLARLVAIQAACVHRKFPVVVPDFSIALLLIGLAIGVSLLGEQRAFAKLTQSNSNGGTATTQAASDPSAALYERLQAFDALASAESRDIYLQTGIADDAMTRWLEATRAIGPELVAAARNSTARALDLQQGYDLLLPHLSQQRRLVHVMRLLTHDAVARGDSALATDLVGAQVASVRGLGEDHVLVSSLVSIATLRTSLATVTDLIDRASLDSAAAKSIASARDGLGALMQQQLRDAFRTESEFPLQELGRLSALDDAGWSSRMEQWGLTEVEGIDRTNLEAMQDGAVRFRDALNAAVGTEDTKSMGLALQSLEERLHAGDFGPMLKALGPASLRVSVERLESALAQLAEQDAVLEALATGAKQPMELANAARHYLAASRAALALDADTQRLLDALRVAPESLDEADRRTARRAIEALRTSVMDQMLRATSITRCEFDDAAQPEPDLLPEGCEGALGAFRLMLFDPLIPGERPESAAKLADVCVAALTAVRHFAEGGGIGRALIAQHMLRDLTFVLTQPEVARQIDAQVRARFEAQLARFNTQDPLGFQRAIDFERGRIASIGSTPRSTPKGERTAGTPFGRERLARLSPESICFLVATLTSQRPALQQARCTCSFDGPMLDVRGFFDLTALEKAQQQAETLRTRFEAIVLEGSDDNAPAIRSLSVTRPVDLAARHSDALAEVERLRAIASPRTNN